MNKSDKEPVFSFLCSKQWDDLCETEHKSVRHCSQCHKSVFLAKDNKELAELARQGRCAAILNKSGPGRLVGLIASDTVGKPTPAPYHDQSSEIPLPPKGGVYFRLFRKIRQFLFR